MNIAKVSFLGALLILSAGVSYAAQNIPFQGELDLAANALNVVLEFDQDSSLEATAQKVSDHNYRFSVNVEHLKTPLFDILSNVESSVEIVPEQEPPLSYAKSGMMLKGKVWSQYSLLDYKPVKELKGEFEIKNKRLHLTEFSFGNVHCDGYIDLTRPYGLDMTIHIVEMGMKEFLNIWSSQAEYETAGAVSGEIKASGTLNNLLLKGKLESRNGFVQKLNYDSILLNIEGVYPYMKIAQSTLSKSDGISFSFDGPFNLSDRKHFKKQIKELNIAPLVKDTGPEREWTLKRFTPEDSETIEIKYRHREGDAMGIGTSATDEADMFGFERKKEF